MRKIGLALLGLSLVLGLAALWGLHSISGAHATPAPPASRPEGRTTVVVAARPIAFGEALTAATLQARSWPADAAPAGAYRNVSELTGGAPRLALGPIAAGEPILAAQLSGPGGRASLSNLIRPGMRAAAIRVDDVIGVAGFVLPGDFVDVVVTRNDGDDAKAARADVLLQDVRVLAIDQTANSAKSDPMVAKAATIEVTPAQAAKLALAEHVGTLSLALRGAGEGGLAQAGAPASVHIGDLSAGGSPPRRRVRLVRASGPAGPEVKVYRGTDASRVSVRLE